MSRTRSPVLRRRVIEAAAGNEAVLREAVARLGDGDAIVLTGDITLTPDLDAVRGINITIDGAGHFGSETERAS
jgi:hypothetical protein